MIFNLAYFITRTPLESFPVPLVKAGTTGKSANAGEIFSRLA
jgi:hypothetical protein